MIGLLAWLAVLGGGWLDPAVDQSGPLEYFAATECWLPTWQEPRGDHRPPVDQGFRVTAEGHLACRRGRLVILLGDPLRPVVARAKRLVEGWLPAATYDLAAGEATIQVQALATSLDGLPGEVGLLRLSVRAGAAPARVTLAVGYLPDAGYPARWPEHDLRTPYEFGDGCLLRDGQVVYTYPLLPGHRRLAVVEEAYGGAFSPRQVAALRSTPLGLVTYDLVVPARQSQALVFRLPSQPLSPALALPVLRRIDHDEALLRVRALWRRWMETQPRLEVPEAKATEAALAGQVRLRARPWEQASPPPAGAEATRLLRAATERGLVVVRPDHGVDVLSPYLTARRARAAAAAGQPGAALTALYAVLLHSSAAHRLADAVPCEWGQREPLWRWGIPADGRATAEYLAALSELLVREEPGRLRLGSALSAAWTAPGGTVRVARVPTTFGLVGYRVKAEAGRLTIHVDQPLAEPPQGVWFAGPWGWSITSATADGRPARQDGDWYRVPAAGGELVLVGERQAGAETLSYAGAVDAWHRVYQERAEALRAAGGAFRSLLVEWPSEPERKARFEALYGGS